MSLWIIASVFAAAMQAFRFALQKSISLDGVSATGATFARFVYSAPIIAALLGLWLISTDTAFPQLSPTFWVYASAGGLAQIVATVCVVLVFQSRNFAVGVAFAKTETIATAVLGLVLLGDVLSPPEMLAIGLGLIGVLVLSLKPGSGFSLSGLNNRSAGFGLLAGVLFSVSAVSYRGASLELDAIPLLRAGATLSVVTAMQLAAMWFWLLLRERRQIGRVLQVWRRGLPLGLASMGGSFGWFLAFTLQNAALVKAVGQVELIFVLVIGAVAFKDRVSARELWGMALLTVSILLLLMLI